MFLLGDSVGRSLYWVSYFVWDLGLPGDFWSYFPSLVMEASPCQWTIGPVRKLSPCRPSIIAKRANGRCGYA